MKESKKQRLFEDAKWHYKLSWGKFKSDKNKTKNIIRVEIWELCSILHFLPKKDLSEIKDFIKEKIDIMWV